MNYPEKIIHHNQRGFFIPGLPHPYFLIAAGIALVVSFGMGYWRGWSSGMEKYYSFKGQVEAANEQNRIEIERRINEAKVINDRANQGWAEAEKQLDDLRKRGPLVRVLPCGKTGQLPSVSASSERPDGKAEELRSDPEISLTVEQCEARVNDAIDDANKVVHLQEWIINQHKASKKTSP